MATSEKAPGATAAQLADLYSCSPRQVQLYAKDGIVVRQGRGRFDAAASTRNLVRHLRDQAAGRAGLDPDSDTAAAKAERDREQAQFTRTRRLSLEGRLIEVDEVRRVWNAVTVGTRQMVLGIPGRIAAIVPTLSPHDRKQIDTVCRDALKDAALGRGFEFDASAQPEMADGDDTSTEG